MAEPNVVMGGRDTGVEYGPTRENLKTRDAQANVNPNAYAGQEVHPNHADKFKSQEYNRKLKVDKKIEKDRQQVEDRQKRDEWRETNRKQKEKQSLFEKESKEREKEEKKRHKRMWTPRSGVEMPKQGIGRISHASEGLRTALAPESSFDYSDAFSMGGELGGMTGSIRSEMGRPDFGSMSNMFGGGFGGVGFGGLGRAMKRDGKARGFGGYVDPFSGSAPAPKIGRGKGKRTKKSKSQGLGSIFSLRLF